MNSWFTLVKVMARPEVKVETEPEDLNIDYGDNGGDDDDCQCDANQGCQNRATFKNRSDGSKICGFHLNDFIQMFAGNHGYEKWDCQKGEYL